MNFNPTRLVSKRLPPSQISSDESLGWVRRHYCARPAARRIPDSNNRKLSHFQTPASISVGISYKDRSFLTLILAPHRCWAINPVKVPPAVSGFVTSISQHELTSSFSNTGNVFIVRKVVSFLSLYINCPPKTSKAKLRFIPINVSTLK